ncbi:MAG: shikimate kinase [Candidatus Velthaea sp.]
MPPSGAETLFLCGPMGSGKSTVGRALAARLGRRFVDTDDVVVRQTGYTIEALFAQFGEAAFRAHETDALASAIDPPGAVVALGGGALLALENRALIEQAGRCIFLRAPLETLERRLARSNIRRPLLARASIGSIVAARLPLYEAADLTVDVDDDEAPDATAARIAALL